MQLEETRYFEGPHQEEPNQTSESEFGDSSSGLADLLVNQIAVEQADIVTDPLLNAWQDSTHHEVIDECRNAFGSPSKATPAARSLVGDPEGSQSGSAFNTVIGSEEPGQLLRQQRLQPPPGSSASVA